MRGNMNIRKMLDLMKRHDNCPTCGNTYIGNGEGKLIVEDKTFYRSCKCGWEFKVDEDGKEAT